MFILFAHFPVYGQRGTFLEPLQFATGDAPNYLQIGDLNLDGKLDVVTVDSFSSSVSILLGGGDGTYPTHTDYPTASQPELVAIGDFNGDHIPDLAVTCGAQSLSILLGNGDGTFQTHVDYPTGKSPFGIAIADLNGDQKLDLVVGESASSNIDVLLGNGDGSFQPYSTYPVSGSPGAIAISDLNGDRKLDLAVSIDTFGLQAVDTLLGNGDGTFGGAKVTPLLETPGAIEAFDLNHDNIPDLVVGLPGAIEIEVLLGKGDGTYDVQAPYPGGGIRLAIGDFNHDGKLDVASSELHAVAVFLGAGDGTFSPPLIFGAGAFAEAVVTGDVNGDGKPDLVTCGANYDNFIRVLLGNGDGTFQSYSLWTSHQYPWRIAAGDLNRDGTLDLVTGSNLSHDPAISVILGNGNGSFNLPVDYTAEAQPSAVAIADVNGDGKLDVITANQDATVPGVSVLLGNGDGTLAPPASFASGQSPSDVIVADCNRDGKPDLATCNLVNGSVSILLGNGDGTFQQHVDYPTSGHSPLALAAGDFDENGTLDIAVVYSNSHFITILLGNGDGTFATASQYVIGADAYDIAVADFDKDGHLDLATADLFTNKISVLLGDGTGAFLTHAEYITGGAPIAVTTGDFNADGKLDLATANGASASVLFGNGDGTFQAHNDYQLESTPVSVIAADFNHDGALDLASAQSTGSAVALLMNLGGSHLQTSSAPNPSKVGEPVTFKAKVTPSLAGRPIPTGTVTFTERGSILGRVSLQNGRGQFNTSALTEGQHTIRATYTGDANYNPENAVPLHQTVNAP